MPMGGVGEAAAGTAASWGVNKLLNGLFGGGGPQGPVNDPLQQRNAQQAMLMQLMQQQQQQQQSMMPDAHQTQSAMDVGTFLRQLGLM